MVYHNLVERMIYRDFAFDRGYDDLVLNENDDGPVESEYDFDDDNIRDPIHINISDTDHENRCRRTSWHRYIFETCNNMHEFDIQHQFTIRNAVYLTSGAYNDVFLTKFMNHTVILKSYYWGSNFAYSDYDKLRTDSLILERLSSSKRIVDIYNYCGTSTVIEAMMKGDLYSVGAPYGHSGREPTPQEKRLRELVVSNNLTGTEKLMYALGMAEALSELHAFPGGVIVHQDIKAAQFLLNDKDEVKLNDFNRAKILLWNGQNNSYCPFSAGHVQGVWRSPEEYGEMALNEQIDVWSLGSCMYVLLTGLKPHHKHMYDTKYLRRTIREGGVSFIDQRVELRSFGDRKLSEIIQLCYTTDPMQRPDIFHVVNLLRQAVAENERSNNQTITAAIQRTVHTEAIVMNV